MMGNAGATNKTHRNIAVTANSARLDGHALSVAPYCPTALLETWSKLAPSALPSHSQLALVSPALSTQEQTAPPWSQRQPREVFVRVARPTGDASAFCRAAGIIATCLDVVSTFHGMATAGCHPVAARTSARSAHLSTAPVLLLLAQRMLADYAPGVGEMAQKVYASAAYEAVRAHASVRVSAALANPDVAQGWPNGRVALLQALRVVCHA